MSLSIVIAVYQSYEIVRRQVKYFKSLDLPSDIELIIVDDGSEPPIPEATLQTGSKLAWTQGLARNAGAKVAQGAYLLFTDIDHILSKEAIMDAYNFTGDRMFFRRQLAVLTPEGKLMQDREVLAIYGVDRGRKTLDASVHLNTFVIKKATFDCLGGYDPEHSLVGFHPATRSGDDCYFNTKWNRYAAEHNLKVSTGSDIYLFPIGRFHKNGDLNPFNLFHNLSQKKQEKFYKDE